MTTRFSMQRGLVYSARLTYEHVGLLWLKTLPEKVLLNGLYPEWLSALRQNPVKKLLNSARDTDQSFMFQVLMETL